MKKIWNFILFLVCVFHFAVLFPTHLFPENTTIEKPMVVVIASYNNIKWYRQNLQSIFTQSYSNYRVVYVDDCSTDGTADAVERMIKELAQEERVTLIRNEKRQGILANHHMVIHGLCENHEIVLCVDGDDWLAHDQVFNVLNHTYSSRDVWLTHGKFSEYHGDQRIGSSNCSLPIPSDIIQHNRFRQFFCCATHLKTFYAWLFKKIKYEDLLYEGTLLSCNRRSSVDVSHDRDGR